MIEVAPHLFVGSAADFEQLRKCDDFIHANRPLRNAIELLIPWAVVHACKEPYHRSLLGYSSRAAPLDHAEYYVARRDRELFLNLVDAPKVEFIPHQCIDPAISFVDEHLTAGSRVLVHCNLGESRAPSIALLFLHRRGTITSVDDFRKLYPNYRPGGGMAAYVERELATPSWWGQPR